MTGLRSHEWETCSVHERFLVRGGFCPECEDDDYEDAVNVGTTGGDHYPSEERTR